MGAFQKGGTGGYEPPRIPSKDWRSPDESSICSPPACAEREGAMGSLRSGPQRAAGARALHPLPGRWLRGYLGHLAPGAERSGRHHLSAFQD